MVNEKRFATPSKAGSYAVLITITLFALGPTAWVFLSSFKSTAQVLSGGGILPEPFTMEGYGDVFGTVDLGMPLLNTLLYSLIGSAGAVLTGALAAYPIARLKFRGRQFLGSLFSAALAVPVISLIVPEFFIIRDLGLFDTRAGLILFYIALNFPISFVILRAFFASIPHELEEAARIDGAGYFTILWRIILPLAVPGLVTVGTLVFIGIWNEFFFANLLTLSNENWNAQIALAGLQGKFQFNVSAMLAGATMVMLVPLAVFLLLQRYVVAGLTAGSGR
jgi:raffinose/stachyose/melibiose transport system permease protein